MKINYILQNIGKGSYVQFRESGTGCIYSSATWVETSYVNSVIANSSCRHAIYLLTKQFGRDNKIQVSYAEVCLYRSNP